MINHGYDRARQRFATANGWRIAKRGFGLDVLARNGTPRGYNYYVPVDHAEYYLKDRRAVAIVGHNYDGGGGSSDWTWHGTETITQLAAEHGLIVHVAPAGKAASWYYPNGTIPLVITHPGIAIVWPTPAQMAATAQADAAYQIRQQEEWDRRQRRAMHNSGAA